MMFALSAAKDNQTRKRLKSLACSSPGAQDRVSGPLSSTEITEWQKHVLGVMV